MCGSPPRTDFPSSVRLGQMRVSAGRTEDWFTVLRWARRSVEVRARSTGEKRVRPVASLRALPTPPHASRTTDLIGVVDGVSHFPHFQDPTLAKSAGLLPRS